jgi:hypothetical protein
MKDVKKFYGHSVYVTAISYILWPFGMFCGNFGIFFPFWYIVPRKSGNPVKRLFLLVIVLRIGSRYEKQATD